MKLKYRSNLVAGIVSILLGGICWMIIPSQIAEDYAVTYGITSKTVPYAVAALWVICGFILIAQSLIWKKDDVKSVEVKKEAKALGYMAVILVYALLFKKSFLVSTAFLGIATLAFTGTKKKSYYGIILVVVLALYLLFSKVLHIQMP